MPYSFYIIMLSLVGILGYAYQYETRFIKDCNTKGGIVISATQRGMLCVKGVEVIE